MIRNVKGNSRLEGRRRLMEGSNSVKAKVGTRLAKDNIEVTIIDLYVDLKSGSLVMEYEKYDTITGKRTTSEIDGRYAESIFKGFHVL